LIKIVLKPGKEQSLKRFHPWIFSGALKKIPDGLQEGDPVEVFSSENEKLGTGHYHSGSIAVRMLTFGNEKLTGAFWRSKIEKCLRLREEIGLAGSSHTNVYRLVNAEGDGLPGLIIDYYKGTAVIQAHSAGMHRIRRELAAILQDVMGDSLTSVYCRGMHGIAVINENKDNAYLSGSPSTNIVEEHGKRFAIDWVRGQKTGFFIDQRENRKLLGQYSRDKKILNMFGYTGGFSVYALEGGARQVHTVDSSAKAIEMADENVALNFESDTHHESFCMEAFDFFSDCKEGYDIVILDPPAFAKGMRARNNALRAYMRLNSKAFEMIVPGGLLFTFSCSQVVGRDQFRQAVYSAAILSAREIRILHHLSQPADHPVSVYHPEGEYLKGLVLQVI
jgi:23S rRNA (cytosine1962-C5)-methyltransferase